LLQQEFCCVKEATIFTGVVQWLKKQYKTNTTQKSVREILVDIYPHIRFPLMDNTFLANEVYASGILTSEELLNIYRAKALKNYELIPFKYEKRMTRLRFGMNKEEEEKK